MGVAGVALATIIAQAISAGLILLSLEKSEGVLHLRLKELSFHKDKLFGMLRVGLPAGLQGVIFNISNVLIQSSINSFGSVVMAGNTAASNIEGFVYTSMNAVYQTSLSFTSQNYGEEVIQYGIARLSVVSASYFLCGIMDVFVGSLRGIGYSIMPMLVSLAGACLFRIIWIFTIFQVEHTQFSLYVSYPISWMLTISAHFICYLLVRKKAFAK